MSAPDYDYEDDIYDDYYAPHECDCLDPDIDTISGHARCFECGRSWFLSSEELNSLLKSEAEAQAYYDRDNRIEHSWRPPYCLIRWTRHVRAFFAVMNCCGRRWRHTKDCDGIPF